MRRNFMATISTVLVLVMFAGSTLAFAAPVGDVQLEQFSALQGIQAGPLSNEEMSNIEGKGFLTGVTLAKFKALMKLNMNIYSKVGWELGRYIALKKTGFDAGPWPGYKKAMGSSKAGKMLKIIKALM